MFQGLVQILSRKLPILLFLFCLTACVQGGAVGEIAPATAPGESRLGDPVAAGPVDRPPILVEGNPQGNCQEYIYHAEDYEPEEVPEVCREIHQAAREGWVIMGDPVRLEEPAEIETDAEGEDEETPRVFRGLAPAPEGGYRLQEYETFRFIPPEDGDSEDSESSP